MEQAPPSKIRLNLAIAAIVILALALRALAFSPFEISHADEIMQYLEQARRLATGEGIVPWEYRYGARNGLIAQLLVLPWWLGEAIAPGTLAPMLVARWTFLALTLPVLLAAWKLGAQTSWRHALAALFVAGVWYESVVFANLLLSEVFATGLIALGAALLLEGDRTARRLHWAGLLLGLGVVVRLQYAPFAAVLALAALRTDWRGWRGLILGGLAAAAIGAASDLAMGRWPFEWIRVNLAYNLGESRAARFGASPPLEYARWLLIHLGPGGIAILAGAVLSPPRYRPLVWAIAVNLVFHSLVTHKEYRFVWLSTTLILVLAAIASVSAAEWLMARRGRAVSPALLGALLLAWLGASLAAERQSGGAAALRGGAPIPLAALDAARRPEICGIALPDQWRAHLVPALLPRPVPLYVANEAVLEKGAPLAPGLTGAANALVLPGPVAGSEGYRLAGCQANTVLKACLFVRPGTCRPDPYWSYQAALEREDL
jgi:hypothetical protein